VIVTYPERLPLRYGGSVEKTVLAVSRFAVEWTDYILPTLNTCPEYIDVEVQAIRIGDVLFAIHPAELFSTLGLAIRTNAPTKGFICPWLLKWLGGLFTGCIRHRAKELCCRPIAEIYWSNFLSRPNLERRW